MFYIYIIPVLILLLLYAPTRFYIFSYYFSQLYDNVKISTFFGIRYVDVNTWRTDRTKSRIYSSGIFVKLLRLITGMNLRVSNDTMNGLIQLQNKYSKEMDMEPYFQEIDGKAITLQDFEYFLSRALLLETNKLFKILNEKQLGILLKHITIIFDVLNGLSGGMTDGFLMMIKYSKQLYEVSKVLKELPEPERLIVFGPQLSLVTNFTKMIWRKREIFDHLEPHDFLDLLTKFFVFESWESGHQELIFARRDTRDMSNTPLNKAFGPTGVVCPGARMTMHYIKSILSFLQTFNITFTGDAIIEGNRFKNITNKDKVYVQFIKK